MKQAWSDLKSFVTIAFTLTIVALVIIVAIQANWEMFQLVFVLFTNLATAVFTYFFTRKSQTEREEKQMEDELELTEEQEKEFSNGKGEENE